MNLLRSLLLVLSAASLAAACARAPALSETPDFGGTLAEFRQVPRSPGYPVRVVVERPGSPVPADRAIVHVGPRTEVRVVDAAGATRPASLDELAAGDELLVWTTGIELRSYPVQVYALRIDILR